MVCNQLCYFFSKNPHLESIMAYINYDRNFTINSILSSKFKLNSFKHYQKEIINTILDNKDGIFILPTGYGKSLCYQLPAVLSEGITIVISPLVSLLNDQYDYLKKINVSKHYIGKKQKLL